MKHYLEWLADTIRQQWDDGALADYHGRRMTYGDLAVSIEKTRLALRAAGVRRGDNVALCARNCAAWAETYLGIVTYGAVAVPILSNFTPEDIVHLVDHSGSLLLFTDKNAASALDVSKAPTLRAVVSIDDWSVIAGNDKVATDAFARRDAIFAEAHPDGYGPNDVSLPTDNDEDLAVINYTSGTTSAPKGVMLRHGGFSVVIDYAQRMIPTYHGDRIVSMLPMAHMYGLAFEMLYPLISGVEVVFLVKIPSPTALVAAMKDVRPYIVITVPMVMEKIYRNSLKPALSKPVVRFLLSVPGLNRFIGKRVVAKLIDAFGGNIRTFVMGGAPLNPEAEAAFRKIGLPYTVGYGMTEACPLLAYEDWRKFAPGSCGKPVDYDEVRIDSPDPLHVDGEVQAKGPNLCVGYYRNPEATKALFTEDGFLRTGDLGHMDEAGNLYLSGRSKNMILSSSGQNIYPEEIEAVVNQQDFVAESVVVDRGGKLVALVYFDPDAITKAQLNDAAVAALPGRVLDAVNHRMPAYSKLAEVEPRQTPFEKTPKLSIKRFLYK